MKKLRFKDTCTKYTVARNRYGDLELSNPQTILCLFRDISMMLNSVQYREETNILGLFWFDPTAQVKKSDVISFNGVLYRIEQVTNAKELLTSNAVSFIKCTVSLYRAIS